MCVTTSLPAKHLPALQSARCGYPRTTSCPPPHPKSPMSNKVHSLVKSRTRWTATQKAHKAPALVNSRSKSKTDGSPLPTVSPSLPLLHPLQSPVALHNPLRPPPTSNQRAGCLWPPRGNLICSTLALQPCDLAAPLGGCRAHVRIRVCDAAPGFRPAGSHSLPSAAASSPSSAMTCIASRFSPVWPRRCPLRSLLSTAAHSVLGRHVFRHGGHQLSSPTTRCPFGARVFLVVCCHI